MRDTTVQACLYIKYHPDSFLIRQILMNAPVASPVIRTPTAPMLLGRSRVPATLATMETDSVAQVCQTTFEGCHDVHCKFSTYIIL